MMARTPPDYFGDRIPDYGHEVNCPCRWKHPGPCGHCICDNEASRALNAGIQQQMMAMEEAEQRNQPRCYTRDPQLGLVPAIPYPFHNSRWSWKKFRMVWIPYCREHGREFADIQQWENHYVLEHIGGEK